MQVYKIEVLPLLWLYHKASYGGGVLPEWESRSGLLGSLPKHYSSRGRSKPGFSWSAPPRTSPWYRSRLVGRVTSWPYTAFLPHTSGLLREVGISEQVECLQWLSGGVGISEDVECLPCLSGGIIVTTVGSVKRCLLMIYHRKNISSFHQPLCWPREQVCGTVQFPRAEQSPSWRSYRHPLSRRGRGYRWS